MTTDQYLNNINQRDKMGNAIEHNIYGNLQQLFKSLVPDIRATNEPKRLIEVKDTSEKGMVQRVV